MGKLVSGKSRLLLTEISWTHIVFRMDRMMDTHFHLTDHPFSQNPSQIVDQARTNGVDRLLVPGYSLKSCQQIIDLKKTLPDIDIALGFHPLFDPHLQLSADTLEQLVLSSQCVAIGEIGLDYRQKQVDKSFQKARFVEQLSLSQKLKLPVIIHCVKAHDDCIRLLSETLSHRRKPFQGVIHRAACTVDQASKYKQMGFLFSFGPDILDSRRKKLQTLAVHLDSTDIILETDAPYSVTQHKTVSMPWTIFDVLRHLAKIRNESASHLSSIINQNCNRLFGE